MERRPSEYAAYKSGDREPAEPRTRRTNDEVLEAVLENVDKRGGQCLSLTFRNRNSRMVLRCAKGHIWRTRIEAILRGSWCHTCGRNKIASAIRHRFGVLDLDDADEMAVYAESLGLIFVAGDPLRQGRADFFRCLEGHLWEVPRETPAGAWCPVCGVRGTALGVGRIVR